MEQKLIKPEWLKIKLSTNDNFSGIKETLQKHDLHTVCESAHCPNISECWSGGTATFMILGDTCTRGCKFCNIKTGFPGKKIDENEPYKIANAVKKWGLGYIVVTSVNRDDLPDQGSEHFAKCIKELKKENIIVEVLIPDFKGDLICLKKIIDAKPNVIAHNIETVKKFQRKIRDPRANYEQSLKVLKNVKEINKNIYTKSSLMVGIGETKEEVKEAMIDLRNNNVDIITIGQYLRPSKDHYPIYEYIKPELFKYYEKLALKLGFKFAASGPFVRSSYKAGELFIKNILKEVK